MGAASIVKRRCMKCRSGSLRIGAWNIQTLPDRYKVQQSIRRSAPVVRELDRYQLDIVALGETPFPDAGHLQKELLLGGVAIAI